MEIKGIKDLLIVIVLYNTSFEESISLVSLNENAHFVDVLVYDNSPIIRTNDVGNPFQYLNIEYLHDPTNPGVSRAYNKAAEYAMQSNKSLLLLLDQDTYLPKDSLVKYLTTVSNYPDISLMAPRLEFNNRIYSPCNYFMHKGFHKKQFVVGVNPLKRVNFLNSGVLLRVEAFKKVGGYDESIRLYFSDFEFINRFRLHYKYYFLLDLTCKHELASTDKSDINKAINRFVIYCRDGKSASKSNFLKFQYFITIGLRSVKLSVFFKNFSFIKAFYTHFI